MKKLLVVLFSVISVICSLFVMACGKDGEIVLVDFNDKTVTVQHGSRYTLEDKVYDTLGNEYALTAVVKDADDVEVETSDGGFNVEKDQYSITYSTEFDKETMSKTVTLKTVRKPIIELSDKREKTVYFGQTGSDFYTIPTVTVKAYQTDDEGNSSLVVVDDAEVTVEIFYKDVEEDVKVDYDVENGIFKPDKIGEYYLKVTAKHGGMSNVTKVNITCECTAPIINVTPFKTEINFNTSTNTPLVDYVIPEISVSDVAGNDITAEVQLEKSIWCRNENGNVKTNYDGGATYTPTAIGNYTLEIKATNEYGASAKESLTFIVKAHAHQTVSPSCYPSTEGVSDLISNGALSFVEAEQIPKEGITNLVEYDGDAYKISKPGSGAEIYLDMEYSATEIEQVIAEKYNKVRFSIMFDSVNNINNQVKPAEERTHKGLLAEGGYMRSDGKGYALPLRTWITCEISVEQFAAAMRVNDGDDNTVMICRLYAQVNSVTFEYDVYVGEIEFYLDDSTLFKADALSVNKFYTNNGGTSELVKKADLPISGYDGDVIKLTTQHNRYLFVRLTSTATQLSQVDQTKYNAVEFSMLIQTTGDRVSNGDGASATAAPTNVARIGVWTKAGYSKYATGTSNGNNLPLDQWITIRISLNDFIEVMGNNDNDESTVLLGRTDNQAITQPGMYFYISTIKLTYASA